MFVFLYLFSDAAVPPVPEPVANLPAEQALPLLDLEEHLKEGAFLDVELALASGQQPAVRGIEAHRDWHRLTPGRTTRNTRDDVVNSFHVRQVISRYDRIQSVPVRSGRFILCLT